MCICTLSRKLPARVDVDAVAFNTTCRLESSVVQMQSELRRLASDVANVTANVSSVSANISELTALLKDEQLRANSKRSDL